MLLKLIKRLDEMLTKLDEKLSNSLFQIMQCEIDQCQGGFTGDSANLFLTLISTLFTTKCGLDPKNIYQEDFGPNLKDGDEFDFIIVGAGSAGSVTANRLSENPNMTVLLLEAGGYPTSDSETPALILSQLQTKSDWQFLTEPSENACLGIEGGRCRWSQGKILGGSSAFDAMIYVRPNENDFKVWEAMGNTGWDYATAMQFFALSQACTYDLLKNRPNHGTNGFLTTSHYTSESKMRNIIHEAAAVVTNITDDQPLIGFYEALSLIENGKSCSAAKAFVSKIKDRKNLFLSLHSHVEKVLIHNLKATGVEVKIGNKVIKIKTKKEVILSAGTVNSPKILMLSGIGKNEHLDTLGIETVMDLPVGYHLEDHIADFTLLVTLDPSAGNAKSKSEYLYSIYQYMTENKGPLSNIGVANNVWFFSTENSTYPNIEVLFLHYPQNDEYLLPEILNKLAFNSETKQSILAANKRYEMLSILPLLLNPKSSGRITLRSKDPYDKPIIEPNYFSNPDDLKVMVDAVRHIQKFVNTPAFAKYNASILDFASNCTDFDSDEFWECHMKHYCTTIFHATGTCKMSVDETSVVDPRLRVHGNKHLRVIDASIMHKIVSGNTTATAIMVGDKGADMILDDWDC